VKRPKISVLVTVYNRELYLEQCLRSILESTFVDFEIIVVDDHSADRSPEIAQDFAAADSRIRFYVNDSNLGDYPNRNKAASHAAGEYLKYVDADDALYPDSLGLMVRSMERWPDAALGLSWNVINPPRPFPFVSTPRELYVAHYLGTSLLGVGPSAAIVRRTAFEAISGFKNVQFVGDSDLWLRLGRRWPTVSLPPALVWWRRHDDQQVSLELTKPEILNVRYSMERSAALDNDLLTPDEKNSALSRLRSLHGRRLLRLFAKDNRPLDALRLWRDARLSPRDFVRALSSHATGTV